MERTVTNLLKTDGFIFLRFTNIICFKEFMQKAEDEGFVFRGGGCPTKAEYSNLLFVDETKAFGYAHSVLRMAFSGGFQTVSDKRVSRIDVEKYLRGDEDYIWKVIRP